MKHLAVKLQDGLYSYRGHTLHRYNIKSCLGRGIVYCITVPLSPTPLYMGKADCLRDAMRRVDAMLEK